MNDADKDAVMTLVWVLIVVVVFALIDRIPDGQHHAAPVQSRCGPAPAASVTGSAR